MRSKKDYEIMLSRKASPDQLVVSSMGIKESRPYIYHPWDIAE